MRTGICLLFAVSVSLQLFSQDQFVPNNITPPSPNAASLGRFGDIPIGNYTGTPAISVPLYEIKCGKLSLPVTLSYDATGLRVAMDASWVGAGWSLSAGGLVTRVVRGKDDFGTLGYYSYDRIPGYGYSGDASGLQTYYLGVASGGIDGEPDIFSYNFAGYSGKFVIDKQANGGTVYESDRNNLDIRYTGLGESFTITTPDGNQYYFSTKEAIANRHTTDYSSAPGTDLQDYVGLGNFIQASEAANSAWYLDRITSPVGDTIKFIYTTGQSLSLIFRSSKHFLSINPAISPGNDGIPVYASKVDTRQSIQNVILQRIEFTNGKVEFETSGREDIEAVSTAILPQRLSGIKVYNNNQVAPIRQITLGQSYFNPGSTNYYDKRLKLDYVQIDQEANRYSFSYYKPNELPSKYSRQVDEWGFYTSPFQNPFSFSTNYPDLYPRVITPIGVIDGVPQQRGDVSGDYIKRGILTSMTYATKGRTDFDYEPNDYSNGDPQDNVINQMAVLDFTDPLPENWITGPENAIVPFTLTQNTFVSFSAYTSNTGPTQIGYLKRSNGDLLFTFSTGNTIYNTSLDPGDYTIEVEEISGQRTQLSAQYDVIQYPAVTIGGGLRIKSITNYDADNTMVGKKTFGYRDQGFSTGLILNKAIDYYFKDIFYTTDPNAPNNVLFGYYLVRSSNSLYPDGFSSPPNIIGYSKVSITDGINSDGGTTIYNYYNQEPTDEINPDPYPDKPSVADIRNGQLLSVEMLDAAGNPVQKTEYAYVRKEKYGIVGFKVYKAPFDQDRSIAFSDGHTYNNSSEWWVQSQKVETGYSNNGLSSLVKTTSYNYDNPVHKQITSNETTQSDNTTRKTYFKYPHDFQTQQPYTDMVSNHIWTPVIEQSTFKSVNNTETFLQSIQANYKDWGAGVFAPETVSSRNLHQTGYDSRLLYTSYDQQGNTTTVAKENDVKHAYIWGYNKAYLIAEALNASADDIAFTSFEANADGNWVINSSSRVSNAITGTQCYDVGNGSVTKAGLNASKTYIVSYWTQPGSSITIAGAGSNVQLLTRNGWNYREATVSGTTGIVISGSGLIDELRLYPREAQMTTYTYALLVGVTSQCDVNNRITYYEYDAFSRLSLVRDQDKNILKRICYNYAGQTDGCPVPVILDNAVQSGSFTRNNCGSGYNGSSVTYTVPAGTYHAGSQPAADQLAQTDVNANGQSYANAHGSCTVSTPTVYARLEIGLFDPELQEYAIDILFYSDAACTIPANIPDNLQFQINDFGYDDLYINGVLNTHNTYADSFFTNITAESGNDVLIDDIFSYDGEDDEGQDSSGNTYVEKWRFDYTLVAISGSGVTIIIAAPLVPPHPPGF